MLKENLPYTFGPLASPYGVEIDKENDKDIIIVETKQKKLYLQRYYG